MLVASMTLVSFESTTCTRRNAGRDVEYFIRGNLILFGKIGELVIRTRERRGRWPFVSSMRIRVDRCAFDRMHRNSFVSSARLAIVERRFATADVVGGIVGVIRSNRVLNDRRWRSIGSRRGISARMHRFVDIFSFGEGRRSIGKFAGMSAISSVVTGIRYHLNRCRVHSVSAVEVTRRFCIGLNADIQHDCDAIEIGHGVRGRSLRWRRFVACWTFVIGNDR